MVTSVQLPALSRRSILMKPPIVEMAARIWFWVEMTSPTAIALPLDVQPVS